VIVNTNITVQVTTGTHFDRTTGVVTVGAGSVLRTTVVNIVVELSAGTTIQPNGTAILGSGGGTVQAPNNGISIEVSARTEIRTDGTVQLPPDGFGTVTTPEGAEVNIPGGSEIAPNGTVTVGSGGGDVTTETNTSVEFPGGTLIQPDGTIALRPNTEGTITTADTRVTTWITASIKIERSGWIRLVRTAERARIRTRNNIRISLFIGVIIDTTNSLMPRGAMDTQALADDDTHYLFVNVEDPDGAEITKPDGSTEIAPFNSTVRVDAEGNATIIASPGGPGVVDPDGRSSGSSGCDSGIFGMGALLLLLAATSLRKVARKK